MYSVKHRLKSIQEGDHLLIQLLIGRSKLLQESFPAGHQLYNTLCTLCAYNITSAESAGMGVATCCLPHHVLLLQRDCMLATLGQDDLILIIYNLHLDMVAHLPSTLL